MDRNTTNPPVLFVQALRGVAALVVVLWHGSRFLSPYGTGASGRWFLPGATMGVTLFFLISGFIMVHATRDSDGSWRTFWNFVVKRVTRIWPVWLVALAIYIVLSPKYHLSAFADARALRWLLGSAILVPTRGQGPGAPPGFDYPVLGVGWTLDYEIYFYAFFAVSLLFGRWRWWALCGWVAATLVLLPMMTGVTLPPLARWSPYSELGFSAYYLKLATNPIVLLFAIGAVIGTLYERLDVTMRDGWMVRILVLATVTLVAVQWGTHFRMGNGVFEWGLSLIPLMLAFCVFSKTTRWTTPVWLVWLGNISYSLYLFHPVVQEAYDVQGWLPTPFRQGIAALFLTTALSVCAAATSHYVLERGLCVWLQQKLLRRRRRASGTGEKIFAPVESSPAR